MKHIAFRKAILSALLAIFLLTTAGCGSQSGSQGSIGSLNEDGDLVIEKTGISETAAFADYDADGVTVQILVIADSAGNIRAAYNTCQACSPSPMAYFVQKGSSLICQNCGNAFTAEDVGASASGCNPMQIENLKETEDAIIVPASELERMRSAFENWKG